MEKYRKSSHAVYQCKYHFVWVPKYRFKVLQGDVKEEFKEILHQLCENMDIEIIQGKILADHVDMYLSIPPKYSPSEVMKKLKGKSAGRLSKKFPELKKRYWGQHIWARGYFVTTGGVDDQTIQSYIKKQEEEERKAEQLRLWSE